MLLLPRREGTVLLRCTPLVLLVVLGLPIEGVTGVGPGSDRLLFLLVTETLRRRLPHFRTLSAPALAFELDRPMTVLDRLGVVGVPGALDGVGTPLCTSRTVSESAAVPCMPIKKLSWLSIRKMRTSWLSRYSGGAISCCGWLKMPG